MDSTSLGSPRLQFREVGFWQKLPKYQLHSSLAPNSFSTPKVKCGLRKGTRKPLWKSRVLSNEAIQAVQSLKLAKSNPSKLEEVFNGRVARLLKADLLDALAELRRQSELDLALQVFKLMQKEVWYKPDLSLYCDMILLLGKNKLVELAEELFSELKKEGLKPDTRAFTEMIGAYIHVGRIDKVMETYGLMKASGCTPDELTFRILMKNLEKVGEEELLASIKKEVAEYVDSPEQFLQEVAKKHPKRRSLNLV